MRLKLIKIFGVMSFFVQAKRTAMIIADGDWRKSGHDCQRHVYFVWYFCGIEKKESFRSHHVMGTRKRHPTSCFTPVL